MKNTLLFSPTVQTFWSGKFANRKCEELSFPKNPKMCDPIQEIHWKCDPIIVNPDVKMRLHPAAHPH